MTTGGGHGHEFGGPFPPTIGGPDEAQQFVDERIVEGSDFIKIVYDFYGTPGNRVEPGTIWRGRQPSIDRATLGAVIRDLRRVVTIVFAPDETPGEFSLQIDEERIR